uniref:Dynein regulatory complex subunit 2 n=1 Tax=Stegastes partitus TaxID=144197 RepID=A0A3B5A247_9TELE
MPKKTKKGGGKTEEERLVHQQQRAQAEEEMAKKKEETLTLFLKDKLQKEERNTAVNQLKLSESWRMILCQTRAAELHRDAAVQQQTFERQMDELNIIIQRVAADLQEVERQSAHAQRSHLQQVEQLLAQQDRRLQRLQEQWDDCMQDLKSTLSAERSVQHSSSAASTETLLDSPSEQPDESPPAGWHKERRFKTSLFWRQAASIFCVKSVVQISLKRQWLFVQPVCVFLQEACEFLELQPLMQRLNAAVLQRQILKKHEEDLSRENEQLELLLLHLDDAIDGRRALLTVSQAPTTSIPAAADRRHNVIEAVHAVKHSL